MRTIILLGGALTAAILCVRVPWHAPLGVNTGKWEQSAYGRLFAAFQQGPPPPGPTPSGCPDPQTGCAPPPSPIPTEPLPGPSGPSKPAPKPSAPNPYPEMSATVWSGMQSRPLRPCSHIQQAERYWSCLVYQSRARADHYMHGTPQPGAGRCA